MRDPKRIEGYCRRLANIWRTVPDWRFGQLMCNMLGEVAQSVDPFFPEDEELFERMEQLMTRSSTKNDGK